MISVEQVIQELRRVDAGASKCAEQCRDSCAGVESAIRDLGAFDGKAQGAAAGLVSAADHLTRARRALEQLRVSIPKVISQLSE